jgi:hypothetical protein
LIEINFIFIKRARCGLEWKIARNIAFESADFYQNLDVTSGSRNAHLLLQVYQNVCVECCLKICKTYSASKQRFGIAYSRLLYCDKGFVARGPVSDVNMGAGQVRR